MIAFLSSIVFSLVDGIFFLVGEEKIQKKLTMISFIDHNSAELITSGLTTAISILFFGYIKNYLVLRFRIQHDPIIDSIGILIGTFLIVSLYIIFNKTIVL